MNIDQLREIPDPIEISGWKNFPIIEYADPLIELNSLDPRVEVSPQYYYQGIEFASTIVHLRLGAAERLVEAAKLLPERHKLVVFDAFRPLEVQASLFEAQIQTLKDQYPTWTNNQLNEEAQRYVSIPSADLTRPSPHATGGAVDLSVLDPNGRLLDMGTKFDHFGIEGQSDIASSDHPDSLIYSVKADGEGVRNSKRFGIAGETSEIDNFLRRASEIHHPNFNIKQRLFDIFLRQSGLRKFSI